VDTEELRQAAFSVAIAYVRRPELPTKLYADDSAWRAVVSGFS
jgi:hypothetical protein